MGYFFMTSMAKHFQVCSAKDLPRLGQWEANASPLCPFQVDRENPIEDSGGHTLQVTFVGRGLGEGILGGGVAVAAEEEEVVGGDGSEEEDFVFCTRPELLLAHLLMEPMDDNETVIVTVSGSYAFDM